MASDNHIMVYDSTSGVLRSVWCALQRAVCSERFAQVLARSSKRAILLLARGLLNGAPMKCTIALIFGVCAPACSFTPSTAPTPAAPSGWRAPADSAGGLTDQFWLQATPSEISMFGELPVELDGNFSSLGPIESITVNGIRALDVQATPTKIVAWLQGSPVPGPATIVIQGHAATVKNDWALYYDPPVGDFPIRWAAFGASLTQGFQSGGLVAHGQIMSFSAQVFRAAGIYLAPPLFDDKFLPPIQPSAFKSDCNASQSAPEVAGNAIQGLNDPNSIGLDLRNPRKDPTLHTRNFAVGGATVADILKPATFPVQVFERITEQPDGDPTNLVAQSALSQVDRLAAFDPDLVVSGDLLANDSDSATTQSDDLHPEQMTDVATITTQLQQLAAQLGALHGDYFIGNLLPIDGLPNVAILRAQNVPSKESQQDFDAKLAQIHSVIQKYNDALASAVAPYPNLHIVDLWTPTSAVLAAGLDVGPVHLTGLEFGGLLSLDFVHFSDTGYAFMANLFIDAINATKGWQIPHVDLADLLAHDALSPASLKAAGVSCPQI
jgi:lysophospholipase L1-like esterase